jgi:ribosome modulation factor
VAATCPLASKYARLRGVRADRSGRGRETYRYQKQKITLAVRHLIHDRGLETGLQGYEVCLCPYQGDAEKRLWLSGWVKGLLQGEYPVPSAVRPLLRRLGVSLSDGSLEKQPQMAEIAEYPENTSDFSENIEKTARIQEIRENRPRSSKKVVHPGNSSFSEQKGP